MKPSKHYSRLWILPAGLSLLLVLTACENINRKSSVPNMPVSYTVRITSEYPHFVVENGFQTMRITKKNYMYDYTGYAGLLVWVGMDNAYHAADLCCPFCVQAHKPLLVDGIFAVCEQCHEHYDISYGIGNPTKGVTDEPLKRYYTSYRNMPTGAELQIFN